MNHANQKPLTESDEVQVYAMDDENAQISERVDSYGEQNMQYYDFEEQRKPTFSKSPASLT